MIKITKLKAHTEKAINLVELIEVKQGLSKWCYFVKPESIVINSSLVESDGCAPFFLITKSKPIFYGLDVFYGVYTVDENKNDFLFDAIESYSCHKIFDVKEYIINCKGYKGLEHIMEEIDKIVEKRYEHNELRYGFPLNGFCDKQ